MLGKRLELSVYGSVAKIIGDLWFAIQATNASQAILHLCKLICVTGILLTVLTELVFLPGVEGYRVLLGCWLQEHPAWIAF